MEEYQNYSHFVSVKNFVKHPYCLVGIDAELNEKKLEEIRSIKKKLKGIEDISGQTIIVEPIDGNLPAEYSYKFEEDFRRIYNMELKSGEKENKLYYKIPQGYKLNKKLHMICSIMSFYLSEGFVVRRRKY